MFNQSAARMLRWLLAPWSAWPVIRYWYMSWTPVKSSLYGFSTLLFSDAVLRLHSANVPVRVPHTLCLAFWVDVRPATEAKEAVNRELATILEKQNRKSWPLVAWCYWSSYGIHFSALFHMDRMY